MRLQEPFRTAFMPGPESMLGLPSLMLEAFQRLSGQLASIEKRNEVPPALEVRIYELLHAERLRLEGDFRPEL